MKEVIDNSTVLIIDDDQRNIFALKAVLKSRSLNPLCASSAAEGLALINSEPAIKMVLIDMMMPDMDGYEAIREIRRSGRNLLPVVAVTAQAMVGDRDKCLAAGADAYLSKPIDVDQLMEVITRMIK
ncbi:response regulator [Chryseolinea sp. T2]|uniref:response regulator n=1 Tax=Chryseolinea sp. T2 TaxID=3129255 RepID=UPI0030776D06